MSNEQEQLQVLYSLKMLKGSKKDLTKVICKWTGKLPIAQFAFALDDWICGNNWE